MDGNALLHVQLHLTAQIFISNYSNSYRLIT